MAFSSQVWTPGRRVHSQRARKRRTSRVRLCQICQQVSNYCQAKKYWFFGSIEGGDDQRMESESYILCMLFFIFARDDAEDAIDSMDGRTFEGRELRVQLAK